MLFHFSGNVEHFLTVTENMPKFNIETNPQLFRVRQNFEKKNRQSAQIVNNLQVSFLLYNNTHKLTVLKKRKTMDIEFSVFNFHIPLD